MKSAGLALVLSVLAGAAAAQVALQEGNVGRIDVTADLRSATSVSPPYWSHQVDEPGAISIRLRFTNIVDQSNVPYSIVVRDRTGNIRQTLDKAAIRSQGEIWTQPVYGDSARVEVIGPQKPAGLVFTIKEAAYQRQGAAPFSISLPDDREAVREYADVPAIFSRTRPVAKLIFVENGFPSACTGFLIDNDHLLTNHHCVATEAMCKTTVAVFNYQVSDSGKMSSIAQYNCSRLVRADKDLDMALLRLEGAPGQVWGSLALTRRAPDPGEQLFMIQHPNGEPKQISRKDCSVTTSQADGAGSSTDFGHKCDTLRGSSGSPMLGRDYSVIGLHHLGFGGGGQWNDENRAVHSRLIMDRLQLP